MSTLTDRVSKPYPLNIIGPDDIPDTVPPEHPAPWREDEAGNGHSYLYDANNVLVAHVYIWDEAESKLFREKLGKINEGGTVTFYYQFYCNDCQRVFSVPVSKTVGEIPERHRSTYLVLLAEGRKLLWPLDDLSEEEVRKMERETVHCSNGDSHIIDFVWRTGANSD
jgi:hypothetical protein